MLLQHKYLKMSKIDIKERRFIWRQSSLIGQIDAALENEDDFENDIPEDQYINGVKFPLRFNEAESEMIF